jgi:hypothetical protein
MSDEGVETIPLKEKESTLKTEGEGSNRKSGSKRKASNKKDDDPPVVMV